MPDPTDLHPSHGLRQAMVCLALSIACVALPAHAVTLYDAGLGTAPSAQGWFPLVQGAAAAESVANGSYRLDTTGSGVSIFGNARSTPLDSAAGFDLGFTLQVAAESHDSANRAGYSVLMVGSDPTRSLEIAFWADRVWVYDRVDASIDPDRMVHGADAAFDTASAPHAYLLSVRQGQFTLDADGSVLLAGALRDYTSEGGPYAFPNLLFLGDDTSRGSAVTLLQSVTVTAVPEPAPVVLLLSGAACLAWRRRSALRLLPR